MRQSKTKHSNQIKHNFGLLGPDTLSDQKVRQTRVTFFTQVTEICGLIFGTIFWTPFAVLKHTW